MPPNPAGLKFTRDGGLIIHPNIASDSIKIPATATAEGAGFGDTITDTDRLFAAQREPVGHFLVYSIAADTTEKWFIINDPDTEESDPALDRTVQDALAELKFKKKLTEADEYERLYGWSLLIGAFDDAQDLSTLRNPLRSKSSLMQLSVYPKTKVTVDVKDGKPTSSRFGEPVIYKLDRGGGEFLYVHFTRVCKVQTRTNGESVLDPIWDDLTCGRNIRWGVSQWMYRNGGGFPDLQFPAGTTLDKLEEYANSAAFSGLMSRSYICTAQNSSQENNGIKFDFKGSASVALDPAPFFKSNIEQISIATGIPQAKLVGAQAGAVTGSEVNMQDYYKMISRNQTALDETIRWVIDHLANSGQIGLVAVAPNTASDKIKAMFRWVFGDYRRKTAKTYVIDWNSAFELSELDEAKLHDFEASASMKELGWMTPDEVRAHCRHKLKPLPNDEGAKLKMSFGAFPATKTNQNEAPAGTATNNA